MAVVDEKRLSFSLNYWAIDGEIYTFLLRSAKSPTIFLLVMIITIISQRQL